MLMEGVVATSVRKIIAVCDLLFRMYNIGQMQEQNFT